MPAKKQNTFTKNPSEVTLVPGPARDLLLWQAPSRVFKKRDREFFSTVGAIVFLVVVILIFIKEWLAICVLIALLFLVYVMGTVPPEEITNVITTKGIKTGEKLYQWPFLNRFWFSEKWNFKLLQIETNLVFPKHLTLVLKNVSQEEIKKILTKYLIFEKPQKTLLDKLANWLQEKIPLES